MGTRNEREKKLKLDAGDFDLLNEWGNGVCWICKEPESIPGRSLAIDHCHELGTVRGLLCTRCNQVLGRMKDRSDWLRAAADYLDRVKLMYPDMCEQCSRSGQGAKVYPWDRVEKTDAHWTVFRYVCDRGHSWTCGYRTSGAMWMWQ